MRQKLLDTVDGHGLGEINKITYRSRDGCTLEKKRFSSGSGSGKLAAERVEVPDLITVVSSSPDTKHTINEEEVLKDRDFDLNTNIDYRNKNCPRNVNCNMGSGDIWIRDNASSTLKLPKNRAKGRLDANRKVMGKDNRVRAQPLPPLAIEKECAVPCPKQWPTTNLLRVSEQNIYLRPVAIGFSLSDDDSSVSSAGSILSLGRLMPPILEGIVDRSISYGDEDW